MNRDPFYDAILQKLAGPLDPEAFECCVAELLAADWPRLVPVVGGSDGGMDGAVGNDDGPPLPLITTTARKRDVAANLRRNLTTYKTRKDRANRAIFACSESLGGTIRVKLEQVAGDLGFQLAQVYDRNSIAALLYRNSSWTKRLLGLSGMASALSRVSASRRPTIGGTAIGREHELAWLREPGDKVLVGQPGSGKTFLLQIMANDGGGLFLASHDRAALADSIRDQQPATVFVDDAHGDTSKLELLLALRRETKAEFSILATTWPGGRERVEETLCVPSASTYELPRLGRDEIVKVIGAAGITRPIDLVRELVNQAEGRPGLAVTLALMCIVGDGERVVTGSWLRRSVLPTFLEPSAAEVLAAIALTGDEGLDLFRVADALALSPVMVRHLALNLAAGGVLFERPDKRLTVRPPRLRHALIKDVFYGSVPYPIDRVVEALRPSTDALAAGLLGALYVGAAVPEEQLRSLLLRGDTSGLLRDYAWWSPNAARWCLSEAPDRLDEYVEAGLDLAAESFLPVLFGRAVENVGERDNRWLKTIENWIRAAEPGSPAVVRRRKALCNAAIAFTDRQSGGSTVRWEAFRLALFPGFQSHESDPGRGRTVTLRFGILPAPQLRELWELWPDVRPVLASGPPSNCVPLIRCVEDWAYPTRHARGGAAEDVQEVCAATATEMVRDICSLMANRPGVVQALRRITENAALGVSVPVNTVFDVLFPTERFDRQSSIDQAQMVRQLAEALMMQSRSAALRAIAVCEQEAEGAGITFPRLTPILCHQIAESIADDVAWVEDAAALSLPDDCVEPFIERLIRRRPDEWLPTVTACLRNPRYQGRTAAILLQTGDIPSDLLREAVQIDWRPIWLCVAARNGKLSNSAIDILLRDPRDAVAGMTAVGLCHDGTTAGQSETVLAAILRCPADEYQLGEVLKTDPDLAHRFARTLLADRDRRVWHLPESLKTVLEALSVEQRCDLISTLDPERHGDDLVTAIVNNHPEVFRVLLPHAELKALRFAPLRVEQTTAEWLKLIECALDAGVTKADIMAQFAITPRSWSGEESEMWNGRAKELRSLAAADQGPASEILEEMASRCAARSEQAAAHERDESVHGG